jgi:cholesterol transport system auxiliary component
VNRRSPIFPNMRPSLGPLFRYGVLGCALLLASCGTSPLATFDLSAPTSSVKPRSSRGVLVIPEPSAEAPTDGDRIVVRTGASAVAVVKGAQWTDRLPRLLQSQLIQTFENAKLLRSVSRPGDGVAPDHALVWDIRRFEMDATTGEAVVDISVKVLDPLGKVQGAQIFTAHVPGDASQGATASLALDAASNDVLRQIVAWASARI